MGRRNRRSGVRPQGGDSGRRRRTATHNRKWVSTSGSCPSGKKRYASASMAGRALAQAQSHRAMHEVDNTHVEVRHYRCPLCKGHHLTSKKKLKDQGGDHE